jgi:hypothetical protein
MEIVHSPVRGETIHSLSTRNTVVNAFSLSANAGMFEEIAEPAGKRILFGRFMLPDMSEHPCQVGEINADGVKLMTSTPVESGTSIIAYLDDIGRVDGEVSGQVDGGFHLDFKLTGARRERME